MKKMCAVIVLFVFWSGCSYAMEGGSHRKRAARRCCLRGAANATLVLLGAALYGASFTSAFLPDFYEDSPDNVNIAKMAAAVAATGIGMVAGLSCACVGIAGSMTLSCEEDAENGGGCSELSMELSSGDGEELKDMRVNGAAVEV